MTPSDVDTSPLDDAAAHEVRDTEEVGHERRLGMLVDVPRRAELLDLAVGHHGKPVGHRERLFLVVRDVEERDPDLALDRLELDLELAAQLGVERAEGLVEQEHRRREHERPRERDALLLPTRELMWAPLPEPAEADELERSPQPSRVARPSGPA